MTYGRALLLLRGRHTPIPSWLTNDRAEYRGLPHKLDMSWYAEMLDALLSPRPLTYLYCFPVSSKKHVGGMQYLARALH